MKTSQEWWDETKADPAKLNAWLQKQHFGERTASQRLSALKAKFEFDEETARVIDRITLDERKHAVWIKELLETRGLEELTDHDERYWTADKLSYTTFGDACAVAAHAEEMRLERIRVIAADKQAPFDIVTVFRLILFDEEFHAEAFHSLTTPEQYKAAWPGHEEGMKELGLVI
jgi:rubrerythrin